MVAEALPALALGPATVVAATVVDVVSTTEDINSADDDASDTSDEAVAVSAPRLERGKDAIEQACAHNELRRSA